MENINELAAEWEKTESAFLDLKEKRDELELKILRQMNSNFWKDYVTESNCHISLSETETKDIDWLGLSVLLSESEIQNVTKYNIEKKLIIMTKTGKSRIRKLIKQIK